MRKGIQCLFGLARDRLQDQDQRLYFRWMHSREGNLPGP